MSANLKKEGLLRSWKEISSYLGCDTRTCRRWEEKHGLPIHRINGEAKSSVFAYKDELDQWLSLRINQKTGVKPAPFVKPSPKILLVYLACAPLAIVLLLVLLSFRRSPAQPVDFKIQNSFLIALNEKGKELFSADARGFFAKTVL